MSQFFIVFAFTDEKLSTLGLPPTGDLPIDAAGAVRVKGTPPRRTPPRVVSSGAPAVAPPELVAIDAKNSNAGGCGVYLYASRVFTDIPGGQSASAQVADYMRPSEEGGQIATICSNWVQYELVEG